MKPTELEARLKRLESRLVQLMLYLGADPYGANEPEGIREVILDMPTLARRDPAKYSHIQEVVK